MQTHEHKVLRLTLDTESGEMETLLDQLGSKGWTLLSAIPTADDFIWIFRRVFVIGRVEDAEATNAEV